MSAEIRNLLRENRNLTAGEVIAALKERFPNESINDSSAGVAVYNARRKLKIKSRRGGRRGAKTVVQKRVPRTDGSVDLAALQAAAKFVSQIGSADKALEAVRQVKSLQLK